MEPEQIRQTLQQFSGTERYYRHWTGYRYTDGVHFLADQCKAFWLLDLIGSYQPEVRDVPFQVWNLDVREDKTATVTMREDLGQPDKVAQTLQFTDFPLEGIEMYLTDNVLLLPSEY